MLAHTQSRQTVAALDRHKFNDILLHPSYRSDLARCGFFLLPTLKRHRCAYDDEVNAAVCDDEVYYSSRCVLREKTADCFLNSMQQLVYGLRLCVNWYDDYVGKVETNGTSSKIALRAFRK